MNCFLRLSAKRDFIYGTCYLGEQACPVIRVVSELACYTYCQDNCNTRLIHDCYNGGVLQVRVVTS